MLEELVTTSEAAAACGVGYSTIGMWVNRGHLVPCDPLTGRYVEPGEVKHPAYILGDVLEVASETRKRAVGAKRIA